MMTRTFAECLVAWSVILNIGLLLAVVEANDVEFTVSTDVAYVGDEVDFICSPSDFDPDNDEITIRFEGDVLLRFRDDTPMFELGTGMYYTAEMVANKELHLTISAAGIGDSGDYLCAISSSGTAFTSSVGLLVQYFPTPTCFGPNNPNIEYSRETGTLKVETGIDITMYCQGTGDGTTINWSRSDNNAITEVGETLKSLSLTSSLDDHCVDFKCTSTSSMYPDISYSCTISVFTLNLTENPCPTQRSQTTREWQTGQNTGFNTSPASSVNTDFNIGLITGVGSSIGVMLIIVLLMLAVFCVYRLHKRRNQSPEAHEMPYSLPDVNKIPYYSSSISSHDEQKAHNYSTTITSHDDQEAAYYSTSLPNDNLNHGLAETPHHYITKVTNQDDQGAAYYSTSLQNDNFNHGYADISL